MGNLAQAPSYRPTPSSNPTGHIYQPTLDRLFPSSKGQLNASLLGLIILQVMDSYLKVPE